jgi:hypothetical protein
MRRLRLAVAGALILVAGCAEPPSGEISFQRVAILGDSLALQSADEIADAFDPTPVRNESAIGRRIDEADVDARRLAGDDYDAVVVVLGANDARDGVTAVDLDEIDWLVRLLRPTFCLFWLEVPRIGDAAFDRDAAEINGHIAGHADVTLIRWRDRSQHADQWVREDGLHLTPAGQRALAERLYDAVLTC